MRVSDSGGGEPHDPPEESMTQDEKGARERPWEVGTSLDPKN